MLLKLKYLSALAKFYSFSADGDGGGGGPTDPAPAADPAPATPAADPAPKTDAPAGTPPAAVDDKKQGDPAPAGDPALATPPVDPKAYWPTDWRETYANGDEKILNRLKRFDSPKAALDSYFVAEKKINSGALKSALPENATPEQLKAWREDNGIPADVDGYVKDLKLANGLVIGDQDKPVIDEFLEAVALKNNLTPAQASDAVNWYYDLLDKQAVEREQADVDFRASAEDNLRKEWGEMFRRNISAVDGLLSGAPAGVKENIMGARLADGTLLGNHPDTLRWLTNLALEINPAATVVPGSGTNSMSNIDTELAAIEKRMSDPKERDAYFKDEKAQARYRELITAKERITARG